MQKVLVNRGLLFFDKLVYTISNVIYFLNSFCFPENWPEWTSKYEKISTLLMFQVHVVMEERHP